MDTSQITFKKHLTMKKTEVADGLQKLTRVTDHSQKVNLIAL